MTAPHIAFQTTTESILAAVAELRKREAVAPMFLPELEEIDARIHELLDDIEENETEEENGQ